jgi:hypothetical protein
MSAATTIHGTLCHLGNPVLCVPAGEMIGFCDDWRGAEDRSPGTPLVGAVAGPDHYATLSGTAADADDIDLRVRLLFMNRLHERGPARCPWQQRATLDTGCKLLLL